MRLHPLYTGRMRLLHLSVVGLTLLLLSPGRADAQATCVDATGEMCLDVLRAARADGVVDDIFRTSDGRFGPELTFATYIRGVNGCIGMTYDPRMLSGYACHTPAAGEDIGMFANSLDWYWTQVNRTRDDGSLVADGEPGFYIPWRGRIYDIGGEANRVALFPVTDHAPLPCEAFEYSVWLSNDPTSMELATEAAPDPAKWNPARLIRAFREGWTRNADARGASEAARGDLAVFLEDASGGDAIADALVTVWALPCGLSFRYVAIQGGNYGNPGPECAFHSSEDELDAVAGLNEDDTGICVDADGDGHRDVACGGDDCDDTDPAVHPGAFERCDSTRDLDCSPALSCPTGTSCDASSGLCVPQCFEGGCASGFTCVGTLCVEDACAMLTTPCAAGTICRGGVCVDPCDGAVCPRGQLCRGGACVDPCAGVRCPAMQVCVAGDPGSTQLCGPGCTCTEITVPLCPTGTVCDARMGSATADRCVDPGCETMTCGASMVCTGGACVDACSGVVCPLGRTCTAGVCEADRCLSVRCPTGLVCLDGDCVDSCTGVTCGAGDVCRAGVCVPDPCAAVVCGTTERCLEGVCVPAGAGDGGPAFDGSSGDGGRRSGAAPQDAGCACRTLAGHRYGGGPGGLLALIAMLGVALALRRRR